MGEDAEEGASSATGWPVRASTVTLDVGWFAVGHDTVERPTGESAEYHWVTAPDGVAVVALADDELVLVEQYRPRQRRRTLECPGGGVDPDETPVEAARRELREETGYEADHLEHLQSYHPSGWIRHRRHVVLATELSQGGQSLDSGEFIDVVHLPIERAFERARGAHAVGWLLTPLLVARDAGVL